MNINEPIAAISTAHGKGGIAVIRMSGDRVIALADKFFKPNSKGSLSEVKSGSTAYGNIYYDGNIIDTGIATVFIAPSSFTGEDTVEISCHGGIVLAQTVLESAFVAGCRPATAGEFTKRAFLNGKLSLSQAEAVIDLIDSVSKEKIKLAAAQSRGVLFKRVEAIRNELTELLASVYAYIDYPDEDLTDVPVTELRLRICGVRDSLDELISTYRTGHAVCEGIPTVIAGKPNTGKSSLLNMLVGEERAIVTEFAGTTRDTVEETVNVGKITLRLCDTAGIRDSFDAVEKIGVARAKEKLEKAELVLAVFDGSKPLDSEDREILTLLNEKKKYCEIIPIINKNDLTPAFSPSELADLGSPVFISSVNGAGNDELVERISDLYVSEKINYDETAVISNARQNAQALSAKGHIENAIAALDLGMTQDIAGFDLELALTALGELDGRAVASDIADFIFKRFCVGK